MSSRLRMALLIVSAAVLAWPAWRVATALPAFGSPTGVYGPAINALGPPLRHVSNMVTAVNFDFRAFDTLGEEFMLVAAVTGAVLLLRGARGESLTAKAAVLAGRSHEGRGESTILIGRVFGPVTLVFGIYVALHATVTPGGGFQGGVVMASGLLLVYLGEGYGAWRRMIRSWALAALEGGGALLVAAAGVWPLAHGQAFLRNDLPLGHIKDMLSGGLMLVQNAGVALAVTGGFANLFLEFLEETRLPGSEDPAR